jgi:predicted nucleic acid-binding protein
MRLILDTGVLGRVVHPRKHADAKAWLGAVIGSHDVLVSEVCDYELRRELIRIGAQRSLDRLDELERELRYVPVTTSVWRAAARLWAVGRRAGRPTADAASIDGDVLLAAQARAEDAVIVTTNPRHFELFTEARLWTEVGPETT